MVSKWDNSEIMGAKKGKHFLVFVNDHHENVLHEIYSHLQIVLATFTWLDCDSSKAIG